MHTGCPGCSQRPLDSSGVIKSLGLDWASPFRHQDLQCSGIFLNFFSNFVIFGASFARLSLEKVDDFPCFSRKEKSWSSVAHRERRSGHQGPILGVLVEILPFRRLPIESPTSFQDFLSTSQDFIVSRSSTFSLTVHRVSNDFLSSFHDFIVSRCRLSSSFQREKP